MEFETEIISFRAIYTGENKTRTARINGTKQAFASYFRLDLHKTSLNLEQNVRLLLFGLRRKEAQTSFNASKWRSYYKDRLHNIVSCVGNIVVPSETRIIAEQG